MAQTSGKSPLEFSCNCGELQGHLDVAALRTGTHTVCYCPDCRAAELYFGQPDPAPGPVDQFQTTPDMLTITRGVDKLGLMRLGPRGLMRWYATCCNAPLFNTLTNPKLAFVGINGARMAEPERLGRVVAKGFVPQSGGKPRHQGVVPMVWGLIRRMGPARMSGRWKQTPFFDPETGDPVAVAEIPSKQARAALYPDRPAR